MEAIARPLPSPAMPYEEALAAQAYLVTRSNSLLVLQLREFHAYGLVHGHWCAGAISQTTRDADIRSIGTMAQRRRETLASHTEHYDLAQRIDPVIVEVAA